MALAIIGFILRLGVVRACLLRSHATDVQSKPFVCESLLCWRVVIAMDIDLPEIPISCGSLFLVFVFCVVNLPAHGCFPDQIICSFGCQGKRTLTCHAVLFLSCAKAWQIWWLFCCLYGKNTTSSWCWVKYNTISSCVKKCCRRFFRGGSVISGVQFGLDIAAHQVWPLFQNKSTRLVPDKKYFV